MFNHNVLRGYHAAFMWPVLLAGLLLAAPAQAAHIFNVISTLDAADTNPGDASCAAVNGACTLRAAVQEANALIMAGTDTNITIALAAGTYTLTGPANEDSAASGDLDILGTCPNISITTPCLTITGNDTATTIIDGGGIDRIFHIIGRNTVKITGITIQNGNAEGADGGGIKNSNGWVTLENCTITNNRAGHAAIAGGYRGGGLANGDNAQMVINNCTISNNRLLNDSAQAAGAFIGGGGVFNSGIMTLHKVIVDGNTGRPFGGGIQNSNGALAGTGKLTLNDSIVRNNLNTGNSTGGGISNHGGAVVLTRTIVRANTALDGGGVSNLPGAGENTVNGSLRVISSVVDGNTGGGILNQGGADIIYSTISGNRANGNGASADGGGIYNRSPGDVAVTNSTITGNNAFRNGGGIFNGRTMTLTNVTIAGNTVDGDGTEIFISVDPNPVNAEKLNNSLRNTIIGGNALPPAGQSNCMSGYDSAVAAVTATAKVFSLGNNLENGNSCALSVAVGDRINTFPNLSALGEHGSPTRAAETRLLDNTHPAVFVPQPGSAAIDAGVCVHKFDQRLYGRPGTGGNGRCDIGAVETDGDVSVGKVDLEVTLTGNVPSVSLNNPVTYTLKVTNHGPGDAQNITMAARIPPGKVVYSADSANPVPVRCSFSEPDLTCTAANANLASGASITVFINVAPVNALLSGNVMEIRARAEAVSPNDYLPGNNGSLDACVSGACVQTAIVPPPNNFGVSDSGGGAFGPLEWLLLGVPGALLLRRRWPLRSK